MKINTDLERMGDLAVDLAERAIEINMEPRIKPYVIFLAWPPPPRG